MKKFFVVALLQIVAFGTCVTKQPTLQLYPTTTETLVYEMSNFFSGEQLSFQFDGEQPNFDISQPITARKPPVPLLEGIVIFYKVTSVLVSLQANIQPENGAWTNDFAFIEKGAVDKSWDLFYAEGYPYASAEPPNFNKKINFVDPTVSKTTLCYDVDYLDKDTFIVDCADNSKITEEDGALENWFYIFKKDVDPADIDTKNKHFNTNYRGYKAVTKRKFQYHEYVAKNFGEDGVEAETKQRVLLRGVLAYGSDQGTTTELDTNCILELYLIDENNNFADTNQHLDSFALSQALGTDPQATQFSLIDFKFLPNGDIYILDAKLGVFIYRVFKGVGWKFQKWLPTMFSDAYGFDLIYKLSSDGTTKKHMVVLYKDFIVTYVEDKMLTGIQLNIVPDYNANIHVSQKYILIWHDKIVHQYSFDNSQKVSQMTINFNTYAVNPYQPDIMYVSNTNAYRYQISSGFLKFPSPTVTELRKTGKVVAIDATDPNNKCTMTITYDVLGAGDTDIKQLKNSPLPDSITFPSEAFDFGDIASGPGLNYAKLGAADSVDVKVHSLWDLKIKGVPEPNPADVVYSDVLINPDGDNRFYVLTQLKNKQVTILDCLSARKDDNHCTCAIQDQFNLDVQLEVFQSWYWYPSFTEQITYIFQDGGNSVGIYVSDDGKSEKIYTLKAPAPISSFLLLDEVYFIAMPTLGAIHIYTQLFPVLGDPIKIDAASLKAQGFTGWETFKPTKIYGNREINSEVFFVRSGRYLLAFNFKKTWTFLKQIGLIDPSEVQVTISKYTFMIVILPDPSTESQQAIQEWNYKYSDNIYQSKVWIGKVYDRYQLQAPLTVDYSFTDGYTLVRALDTTTQKTVLLVFEPDLPYHTALLKVIETNELIPDNTALQVSMDGGSQMFIYLNDGKQQKVVSLLANPLMELTPNALKSQYVTRMDVGILVTNFNNKKQDFTSKNVVFLNTQTALVVNQASLDKRNVDFKFQTSVDTQQLIPLGNDWYSGAAMEFEAHCGSHCDDGYIYIQPPVHPLNHGAELASYSVNDGIPFGNFVVYQTNDKLVFQKTVDGDLGHAYTLPVLGIKCTTIAGDANIIFSGCQSADNKWTVYATRCTQAVKCTPQGTRAIQYAIAKLLYKDSILYIMKGDINNLYLESGEISINKVTFPTESSMEFESSVFNKRELGSAQSIYFSDFDVQNIDGTYHKILITEAKMIRGIVSVDYDLTKNAFRPGTARSHSLSNLINDPAGQHFLGSKTLFYQVRYISTTPLKAGAFDAVILLTFDNVAQYGCQVHFDETTPANNYMDIVFLLNTYGSFTALNKVTVSNGYAAVPYVDATNMVIAIYELPTKFTIGTTIDVAIQSGFTQSYISSQVGKVIQQPKVNEFALILYQIPTKAMGATTTPKLFANVHYGYGTPYALPIEWNIDAQPYLVVENASKLKTQDVTLLATNQFGTATGKINLKAIPKPNDDKGSGSSSNWWWITLLVLFGVALVAGGGYFAYTKLGRRGVDPLLVN